jgi:hypothetical protein
MRGAEIEVVDPPTTSGININTQPLDFHQRGEGRRARKENVKRHHSVAL